MTSPNSRTAAPARGRHRSARPPATSPRPGRRRCERARAGWTRRTSRRRPHAAVDIAVRPDRTARAGRPQAVQELVRPVAVAERLEEHVAVTAAHRPGPGSRGPGAAGTGRRRLGRSRFAPRTPAPPPARARSCSCPSAAARSGTPAWRSARPSARGASVACPGPAASALPGSAGPPRSAARTPDAGPSASAGGGAAAGGAGRSGRSGHPSRRMVARLVDRAARVRRAACRIWNPM